MQWRVLFCVLFPGWLIYYGMACALFPGWLIYYGIPCVILCFISWLADLLWNGVCYSVFYFLVGWFIMEWRVLFCVLFPGWLIYYGMACVILCFISWLADLLWNGVCYSVFYFLVDWFIMEWRVLFCVLFPGWLIYYGMACVILCFISWLTDLLWNGVCYYVLYFLAGWFIMEWRVLYVLYFLAGWFIMEWRVLFCVLFPGWLIYYGMACVILCFISWLADLLWNGVCYSMSFISWLTDLLWNGVCYSVLYFLVDWFIMEWRVLFWVLFPGWLIYYGMACVILCFISWLTDLLWNVVCYSVLYFLVDWFIMECRVLFCALFPGWLIYYGMACVILWVLFPGWLIYYGMACVILCFISWLADLLWNGVCYSMSFISWLADLLWNGVCYSVLYFLVGWFIMEWRVLFYEFYFLADWFIMEWRVLFYEFYFLAGWFIMEWRVLFCALFPGWLIYYGMACVILCFISWLADLLWNGVCYSEFYFLVGWFIMEWRVLLCTLFPGWLIYYGMACVILWVLFPGWLIYYGMACVILCFISWLTDLLWNGVCYFLFDGLNFILEWRKKPRSKMHIPVASNRNDSIVHQVPTSDEMKLRITPY